MLSQRESVRGDVILCCDTSGNVQNVLLIYKTVKCRYDGYDGYYIPQEPRDLRYVTERPVGDYERCPRFFRVLLKRLIT